MGYLEDLLLILREDVLDTWLCSNLSSREVHIKIT
jgi:hypothetical protein